MQNHFQPFKRLSSPRSQLGIFGISLGGGKEKSSFQEKEEIKKTTDQTTTAITTAINEQTGTQKTTASKTAKSKVDVSGTSVTTALDELAERGSTSEVFQSLDAETQALLQGLIGDLGEGGLQELMGSLTGRALGADKDLAGIVDPIVASARANLEEGLGQTMQGFARSAGGTTQNTIVQQLGLKEASRVESEVASLAATLGLEVRQLATEELTSAAGLTGDLLSQLTGQLKGAKTTRAGETTTDAVRALEQLTATESIEAKSAEEITSALSETALSELSETVSESTMQEIINAISKASGTGKTKGSSFGISLGI